MIKNLSLSRAVYLEQATIAEIGQHLRTCESIIETTVFIDGADKQTWLDEVDTCLKDGHVMTARYILKHALKKKDQKSLWLKSYELEKQYGTFDQQIPLLYSAKDSKHFFLKLMLAKILWRQKDDPN